MMATRDRAEEIGRKIEKGSDWKSEDRSLLFDYISEEELRTFLSASLAKHKIPTKVWFRTEPIPRNATGKFLKRELRKELIGE